MQALPVPTGKRPLLPRKANSSAAARCMFHAVSRRSIFIEWRSALSALPAASASAPADQHYAAPSSITSRTDFERQYRHHMATPNRYCRYGDVELYAPSEDGAAAILKAVAEPMVRAQRWLRLGDGINHILLYELLKVFAGLGGDRELILAGSDELDALAQAVNLRVQTSSTAMPSRNGFTTDVGSVGNGTNNGNCNGNGAPNAVDANGNGNGNGIPSVNGNGVTIASPKPPATASPTAIPRSSCTPGACSHPGFLLLRTSYQDRDSALADPTASGLLASLSSGAASPLLLVEVHDSADVDVGSGAAAKSDWGGSSWGPELQAQHMEGAGAGSGAAVAAVTAAKYRLWSRMMEAALHAKGSVEATSGTFTGKYGSRRHRGGGGGGGGTPAETLAEAEASGAAHNSNHIVVWGLLTDLKRWRFYCLREAVRQPAGGGSMYGSGKGRGASSPKFELLGSRRLRVIDESSVGWPGLVPALAALYAILCTSEGLAVPRSGEASQALTYDMPHDPHRDSLMRFHLIMGAANAPLYGVVGDWVRRRMLEYTQCRREQKRLREAAEAAAQELAEAVAARRAAAAATEPGSSDGGAAPPMTVAGSPPAKVPSRATRLAPTPIPAEVVFASAATAAAEPATVLAAVAVMTVERRQSEDEEVQAAAVADSDTGSTALLEAAAAVAAEAEADLLTSSLSSGEWDPLGSGADALDEEGLGGLPAAVAAAAETTEYYKERLAAAKQQLAQSRERAARLRQRARVRKVTGGAAGA